MGALTAVNNKAGSMAFDRVAAVLQLAGKGLVAGENMAGSKIEARSLWIAKGDPATYTVAIDGHAEGKEGLAVVLHASGGRWGTAATSW